MTTTTKQPRGLYVLSFAEMLERFGFYSVQILLVLYAIKVLNYSDSQAYEILAGYSALIYATPIIGGYIADHILGFRRSIYLGAVAYIIGYAMLASQYPALFHYALGLLIAGNGFFKSSVSSFVGTLYEKVDQRRDSGFTIFYMCFNVGIASASLICAPLAAHYGWGYGFGVSAVALFIGTLILLFGFKRLGDRGLAPINKPIPSFGVTAIFYAAAFITASFFGLLIKQPYIVNWGLTVFGILSGLILLFVAFREEASRRNKLIVLIILMIFSIVFWALYMQMYLSIMLFIDRNLDRTFFNWTLPTGMFSSLQAISLIFLAPFFASLWLRISHTHWDISIPLKFALGIGCAGAAFLVLSMSTWHVNAQGLTSVGWIVGAYMLIACGELCLSPVGLSTVTQLSPPGLVGMLMGIWFIALSLSYAVAGKIAGFASIPKTLTDPFITKNIYGHTFAYFGFSAIAVAILLVLITPKLCKMMD